MLFSSFFLLASFLFKSVVTSDSFFGFFEDDIKDLQDLTEFDFREETPFLIQPSEFFDPLIRQLCALLKAIEDKSNFMHLLPGLSLQSITLRSKVADYQYNLVHFAVRKENHLALAVLKDAGLNINAVDSCGVSPLHVAVMDSSIDCVKELLALGANQFLCSRDGVLPVFLTSSPEIFELLIDACPADKLKLLLNATMRDGTSLLEHFFHNAKVLSILECHCQLILPSYHFILRVHESLAEEEFVKFAMLFPIRSVMALQGKGIDLPVWSIRQNHLEMLARFIQSGAITVLYFTRTAEGNSLLHEAARYNRPDFVKYLLEAGCPKFILNAAMKSPVELTNDPQILALLA